MSDVKRYDAVHIRYEESNIRYGEGCEVEVVTARDYDALAADNQRLREALATAGKGVHWMQAHVPMTEKAQWQAYETRRVIEATLAASK